MSVMQAGSRGTYCLARSVRGTCLQRSPQAGFRGGPTEDSAYVCFSKCALCLSPPLARCERPLSPAEVCVSTGGPRLQALRWCQTPGRGYRHHCRRCQRRGSPAESRPRPETLAGTAWTRRHGRKLLHSYTVTGPTSSCARDATMRRCANTGAHGHAKADNDRPCKRALHTTPP